MRQETTWIEVVVLYGLIGLIGLVVLGALVMFLSLVLGCVSGSVWFTAQAWESIQL